ncbi:MAG TPA: hypothetical protein VJM08_00380 [Anaerolineales bacterium]|nr:hypothetical protein [Anaerolineales bacterium]
MNSLNVSKQAFYYWLPPVLIPEKNSMEKSGTYAACEQMIQMSCMTMGVSKLDEMLKRLEENGRLSPREHQALLELARKTWRVNS